MLYSLSLLLMSKYFTRRRNDTRSIKSKMRDDLRKFRRKYKYVTKEFRLSWLIRLSKKIYLQIPKEKLVNLRNGFKSKLKPNVNNPIRYNGKIATCRLCEEVDARCRHHIIQLQHGGFNKGNNILALCNDCHKLIHPWMN